MARNAQHHTTDVTHLPLQGIGSAPQPDRQVPVAAIYELKRAAVPEKTVIDGNRQTVRNRNSMFFWGKSRNIDDDPFLRRLSKLK